MKALRDGRESPPAFDKMDIGAKAAQACYASAGLKKAKALESDPSVGALTSTELDVHVNPGCIKL